MYRGRRMRASGAIRDLVSEVHVDVSDLICPLFAVEGVGIRREIPGLPGVYHLSADALAAEAEELYALGVHAVLLFGIPGCKDETGSGAYDPDGVVQRAVRAVKARVPGMYVITDVCLCEYTSHGHCGIIRNGGVDNDATLPYLARTALSHAQSGADMVAPSDMMDGRVGAIRDTLDQNGYSHIPIMAYSVKYASAFYGPFREAAGSAPAFGDRKAYQMDYRSTRQPILEARADIAEGADVVMVKPALPYLDVVRAVRGAVDVPLAAYHVSGEYAMLKAAAAQGVLDERTAAVESLTAIRRAGADMIITYYAREFAQWRRDGVC